MNLFGFQQGRIRGAISRDAAKRRNPRRALPMAHAPYASKTRLRNARTATKRSMKSKPKGVAARTEVHVHNPSFSNNIKSGFWFFRASGFRTWRRGFWACRRSACRLTWRRCGDIRFFWRRHSWTRPVRGDLLPGRGLDGDWGDAGLRPGGWREHGRPKKVLAHPLRSGATKALAGWTSRRAGAAGRRSRRRRIGFAACASSCGRCPSSASLAGCATSWRRCWPLPWRTSWRGFGG